jgi:hypothetical protein
MAEREPSMLVLREADDPNMSRADSYALVENLSRASAGQGRHVELKGADHLLSVQKKLEDSVLPTKQEWMQETASKDLAKQGVEF